jgi:hypothetical protein
MKRLTSLLAAALLSGAAAVPAMADIVDLRLKFVSETGEPLPALPVRVVAGPERFIRLAEAGERGETDGDGAFNRSLDVAIEQRKITLDNWFVRHRSNLLRIAVEMELVGRQALYVIELDQVRDGTVGAISAWIAGADGDFDTQLTFHPDTRSWSMPDDPAGMLMSSIGADLRHHEFLGSAEEGWTAVVVIEKQTFTLR